LRACAGRVRGCAGGSAGRCWWGVSVDPGLSVLPVSPHVSLGVEGTIVCPREPWNVAFEHECQTHCFTRPPRNTHPHKGITIWGKANV